MRATNLLPVLMLAILPAAAPPGVKTEYNEADWAHWDAQARST